MLWDVVRWCDMLWDVMRCCEMMWDVVRCCEMMWDDVKCYEMLWDVVRCCYMLWDVVRCCEIVLCWCRSRGGRGCETSDYWGLGPYLGLVWASLGQPWSCSGLWATGSDHSRATLRHHLLQPHPGTDWTQRDTEGHRGTPSLRWRWNMEPRLWVWWDLMVCYHAGNRGVFINDNNNNIDNNNYN